MLIYQDENNKMILKSEYITIIVLGDRMEKNLEFLKQNLIAHRGMHNIKKGIPENSLIAFQKAIENNYIIELDLHILKDKSVVVFHDDDLNRMTGINKNIKDTTYDEIKDLKLQNTNNYIPLLKDVLNLVSGKVPIIIELKYDTKCGILENETMKILKQYRGKYVIKSFNPFSVYWLKRRYPKVIRGQLASNFTDDKMNIIKKVFLKNMIFNYITKPDFISYDIKGLPNKKIENYREKNLVLGWTIRNNADLEKAEKYCDNFICENLEEIEYKNN